MRRLAQVLVLGVLCSLGGIAHAERTHVVAEGHTLGKIAKRYNVSVEAICDANGLHRNERLKLGQKLTIPEPGARHATGAAKSDAEPEARNSEPAEANESRAHDDAKTSEADSGGASADPSTSTSSGDAHDDAPPREEPQREAPRHEPNRHDAAKANGAAKPNASDEGPISGDGMRALEVPGHGTAYYYEPVGQGRKSLKPVLMYLHGRGGRPREDCKRWAAVARRLGWLICPSGPGARGDGLGWNNSWPTAQTTALATLKALRERYGRRVQLYGNTLIGFSEGAYAALNVGVREPGVFNRWLILAGDAKYLGGPGIEALGQARGRLRRVYLITGEQDSVIDGTHQVERWLKNAGIATRVSTPAGMGHEVQLETKTGMYSAALVWLDRGTSKDSKKSKSVAE